MTQLPPDDADHPLKKPHHYWPCKVPEMQIEKCQLRIGKRKKPRGVAVVDCVLVAAIVGLCCLLVSWVVSSPACWAWCLNHLDMRNWNHAVWSGVGVAILGTLFLFRVWPEGRRYEAGRKSPQPSPPTPLPQTGEGRLLTPSPPTPLPQMGEGRLSTPSPRDLSPANGRAETRDHLIPATPVRMGEGSEGGLGE